MENTNNRPVKRDIRSIADDVYATIGSVKALLSAIDDKVRFYLLDKNNSGPYWELMRYHAMDIQNLLSIAEIFATEAERDQKLVTGLLFGKESAHE